MKVACPPSGAGTINSSLEFEAVMAFDDDAEDCDESPV